jgi:RNA polymerase sigma factor (TIGR02999 family)
MSMHGDPRSLPESSADAGSKSQVTRLLQRWSDGDEQAIGKLMPLVYSELRGLASRHLRAERSDLTLETSALVHEAYLKLIDQSRVQWRNRAHFFAIAAQTMRRILVDHARSRGSKKRGGEVRKVVLDEAVQVARDQPIDLVALDDALKLLADTDPEKSRLVEMRFFGGLTHDEIAEVMQVSTSTVERHWRMARAWLFKTMTA